MSSAASWYYTAPLDPLATRRGDPLGFRGIVDRIADELVPGLTNGTQDGRWLSIVCWILERVQRLAAGRGRTAKDREEAYAWVRPAELLWVAAAVHRGSSPPETDLAGRWLPQRLAVERWIENPASLWMGLSEDAWNRYRYAGPYGVWRSALRGLEVTTSDGFTLRKGGGGEKLAAVVEELLTEKGSANECKPFEKTPSVASDEAWRTKFKKWKAVPVEVLPTPRHTPVRLREAKTLHGLFFKAGTPRRLVLDAMRGLDGLDHARLAGRLAKDCAGIPNVWRFTRLCDAAIEAISRLVAAGNNLSDAEGRVELGAALNQEGVRAALEALASSARAWMQLSDSHHGRYSGVGEFADSVASTVPKKVALALVRHHDARHSGRLWLLGADSSHYRVIGGAGQPSPYSFRLWSLYRLGVQAGCMSHGLQAFESSTPTEDADV